MVSMRARLHDTNSCCIQCMLVFLDAMKNVGVNGKITVWRNNHVTKIFKKLSDKMPMCTLDKILKQMRCDGSERQKRIKYVMPRVKKENESFSLLESVFYLICTNILPLHILLSTFCVAFIKWRIWLTCCIHTMLFVNGANMQLYQQKIAIKFGELRREGVNATNVSIKCQY